MCWLEAGLLNLAGQSWPCSSKSRVTRCSARGWGRRDLQSPPFPPRLRASARTIPISRGGAETRRRRQAMTVAVLPTRKDEAFRYADLDALAGVWPVAREEILVPSGQSTSLSIVED